MPWLKKKSEDSDSTNMSLHEEYDEEIE